MFIVIFCILRRGSPDQNMTGFWIIFIILNLPSIANVIYALKIMKYKNHHHLNFNNTYHIVLHENLS